MSRSEPASSIEPTQDAGRLFVQRDFSGPVVMLNLLKFRNVADHSGHPEVAPAMPISGAEAFDRYVRHTLPILRESGGDVLFHGEGGPILIGPADERWDMSMLIRQASAASFLSFAGHAEYLAGLGHRVAAVVDSRQMPLSEMPYPTGTERTRS
ncbi:hypothetical protein ABB55_00655 [Prosthecomicrobium hirschii]|uniref:DUF1330 domain-containing protein n=1 Tax=Prosthecodimorpha hirschii TaxID=665126 RepID=A0A0P6VVK3_9HYPH|nr:hypothetical protein [Prosthecomicrobium hirschii]KPL50917.1 hypothetical protein ABB55_00655 [Prosthecomicrobium hirschii]